MKESRFEGLAAHGESPAARIAGTVGADARRTNADHAKALERRGNVEDGTAPPVSRISPVVYALHMPAIFLLMSSVGWSQEAAEESISALQVIQRSQQHYRGIRTLQAEFTQVYTAHMTRDEEHGVLMFKKPQKMYWEYRDPTEKYLFANGKRAFFYIPRDRQIIIYELAEDRLFLFFMGEGQVARDFEIEFEREELPSAKENFLVRLIPRQADGSLLRILLEIEPASYQIVRLAAIEPIGARNDYILKNVREDVSIPDRRFRFKPPKGVEIVQENSQ